MIGVLKMTLIGEEALWACSLGASSRVLVAFSGGADSTALLVELVRLQQAGRIGAVAAAHYHHGIRGQEAEEDLSFCRELCNRLNVPFFHEHGDVPAYAKANGLSLESAARVCRYDFLRKKAGEWGADAIATGHHREDQAETVLLHLIRGSGMSGFCGMAYRNKEVVRPLLQISRQEILYYLAALHQSYRTDSTNLEEGADRNRIRHRVLEEMKAINPQAAGHIAHTASLLQEEDEYLESLAQAAEKRCGGSRSALAQEPQVLQKRVLRRFLRQHTADYTGEDIARLQGLLETQSGREATLAGGLIFRAEGDRLILVEKKESYCLPLSLDRMAVTPYGTISIEKVDKARIPCGKDEAYVDADKVQGQLLVRPFRPGEGFAPFGMEGRKLFSDYFTDRKVPLSQRQSPIVFDEQGAVYAAGYTIDHRVRLGESTRGIYHLQYIRED